MKINIHMAKHQMFAFFEESVWPDQCHDLHNELYCIYNEQSNLAGHLSWLEIKKSILNCKTKEELDNLINVEWKYIDEELSEGLNELLENIDTAYLSYPDSEDDDGSGPIVTLIR